MAGVGILKIIYIWKKKKRIPNPNDRIWERFLLCTRNIIQAFSHTKEHAVIHYKERHTVPRVWVEDEGDIKDITPHNIINQWLHCYLNLHPQCGVWGQGTIRLGSTNQLTRPSVMGIPKEGVTRAGSNHSLGDIPSNPLIPHTQYRVFI